MEGFMGRVSVSVANFSDLNSTFNPFQSEFWAAVKQPSGWNSMAIKATVASESETDSSIWSTVTLVMHRRLVVGFSLAYIPFGPDTTGLDMPVSLFIREFSRELKKHLPWGTICVRYDLPWYLPDIEDVPILTGRSLRTCRESVQPEGTTRIDLSAGYEAVRLQFRERAKRNIRKAQAKGVVVTEWNGRKDVFSQWYHVYQETAKRDGFAARSEEYLQRFLDTATYLHTDHRGVMERDKDEISCHLYLAYVDSKLSGGTMVLESKGLALYLFGASLRIDGCSFSYLLQDFAIQKACEHGCTIYDFYGISGPKNRGAHLDGLRLFKRAFGGYNCYRQPSTDYVFLPIIWSFYSLFEKLRYAIHRHRHPKRISQQFSVSNDI
jgi:lipid II:glycine glycyltransferase (peptidoglycan interpeptide bridge formation enzyme)